MEVQVNASALTALAKRFKREEEGKQYRKDLVTELRQAAGPGVSAVKESLRGIPSRGLAHPSPALGSFLASKTAVQVRTSGQRAGVRVRIPQTPQVRGFKLAARRLNRGSWRHRVFGRDTWVTQRSPIPGFFDDELTRRAPEFRAGVVVALRKAAARLSR